MTPINAIEMRHVSFRYYRSQTYQLSDISLTIKQGEFVAVLGDAKSTLCMAMCGVVPNLVSGKMEGQVLVNGKDTTKIPIKDIATEVGVVLQDPENQLFNLTVEGDIAFGMENLCVPREEMLKRIDYVLDLVDMSPFRYVASSQLSGGQKQRANIAAVLAMQPKILILDEPTRELDPLGTAEVFELLGRLKKQGITIVIVENDAANIAPLADRMLLIRQGKIVIDAEPREFYKQTFGDSKIRIPQVTEAFFRTEVGQSTRVPLTVEEGIPLWQK